MQTGQTLTDDDRKYLESIEAQIAAAQQTPGTQNNPYSPAMFSGQSKQNLVEWQLDFKPELEAIERSLRNDIMIRDEKTGNEYWITNPDVSKILLNDLGVSDVLKKIILLINKNKVLSNYDEDQIQIRMKFISHGIRELIYLNYEHYGMDNDYKWNCYYSLVVDIDDMIEAAYRRALNGEERRDLNQARVVQQNEPISPQNINFYPQMQQKKSKWFNPFTWGR